MPGMTGNQWFDNTELARSEGGLLKADKIQSGNVCFWND
jgi:sulfide:quinone oxidoreductase